jgi:hypothetical protein
MNDEESTHEGMDATVVGISTRFKLGKGKSGVGNQETGIKGTYVS